MRLNVYLQSTARLILVFLLTFNLVGCGNLFSLYKEEEIPSRIQRILKKTYHINCTCRRVEETLWVYVPLPFSLLNLSSPQQKRLRDIFNDVSYVTSRVLWNSEIKNLRFYAIILADITTGFVFYSVGSVDDLRKYYFERISIDEFSTRKIFDKAFLPEIIGDKEGKNFRYFNISFPNFLAGLICETTQDKIKKKEKEDVEIRWEIDTTGGKKYNFVFFLPSDNSNNVSLLKQSIRHVLSSYHFEKDFSHATIITPSRTLVLLKEDLFGKDSKQ